VKFKIFATEVRNKSVFQAFWLTEIILAVGKWLWSLSRKGILVAPILFPLTKSKPWDKPQGGLWRNLNFPTLGKYFIGNILFPEKTLVFPAPK
jgi:hypothetical protein